MVIYNYMTTTSISIIILDLLLNFFMSESHTFQILFDPIEIIRDIIVVLIFWGI